MNKLKKKPCDLNFNSRITSPFQAEDAMLREQVEQYNRRIRDFEIRQQQYRDQQDRRAEQEAEVVEALLCFSEERKS